MHPIEHLRYVARTRGGDISMLVREAAMALGSLRADHANLVIACRRIVERHPEAGPLWWMCARLLTADDPTSMAWQLVDEIDDDPTPAAVAAAFGDWPTVLTIGWPDVAEAALLRRGDARVLCADSRFEASGFMQRLERVEVDCESVVTESLALAAAEADIALVEAVAASDSRVLAPVGSHVVAAVARSVDTPVWLVAGLGRRLPADYVDLIAERIGTRSSDWDVDIDQVPLGSITHVAASDGLHTDVAAALRPDGPFVPELMRSSPF